MPTVGLSQAGARRSAALQRALAGAWLDQRCRDLGLAGAGPIGPPLTVQQPGFWGGALWNVGPQLWVDVLWRHWASLRLPGARLEAREGADVTCLKGPLPSPEGPGVPSCAVLHRAAAPCSAPRPGHLLQLLLGAAAGACGR